ncbi:MAG: glycosyltransferase family 4 protein [Hyphomicrobiaceae bacterium]|nr:MAG: glycosyltransferase family 4 protein [Hyphomicrobiaceae bacterium]
MGPPDLQNAEENQARRQQAPSALCRKVLLLVPDGRFVLSHFKPLIAVLRECAGEVVVVTHASGQEAEIEALGTRVIDFSCQSSISASRQLASAWALARLFEAESPDAVHLVSADPIVLGCLALKLVPPIRVMLHMTGLGLLGKASGQLLRLYQRAALRIVGSTLAKPTSYVLVESADSLDLLRKVGADPGPRFAILGGVGVDPQAFTALPPPGNDIPVAAFVGRMLRRKGLGVLMQACDRLAARGERLQLDLYGESSDADPDAIPASEISAWCAHRSARWQASINDVREVWRQADFFVLPSLGEGMPRALLEAAACSRPLVVADAPGCRKFVRDGVEGFVVPSGSSAALADALQRMVRDPEGRERMGEAARLRVLQGFTQAHVGRSLKAAYLSLLGGAHG